MTTPQNNIDKKRIAKNTIYLYIRMIIILGVNFYSVRLLLELLGVEDYGVYNVVFGVVTMFSMLSGAMTGMVQRFLSFEIGRAEIENMCHVFSISIYFFGVLIILLFVFGETVGGWFVNKKLNISAENIKLVKFIYQFALFSVAARTFTIPFVAIIVAHEKMEIFAKVSIIEAGCTIGSVCLLRLVSHDRLLYYAAFQTASSGLLLLCYLVYCRRFFPMYKLLFYYDRTVLKRMLRYFSWGTISSVAVMFKLQGCNILLNIFAGVAWNATWSVASKVGGAVGQLVGNFQQAFNPQIVKAYAQSDRKVFFDLINQTSKFSFFLLWIVVLPCILKINFLLKVWLGEEIPPASGIFIQIFLITCLIDATAAPLWVAAQAEDDIKKFQIGISIIHFGGFLATWLFLLVFKTTVAVPIVIAATSFIALFFRLVFLQIRFDFPLKEYFLKSLIPIFLTALLSLIFSCAVVRLEVDFGVIHNLLICCLISLICMISCFGIGFTKAEKERLYYWFMRRIQR